MSYELLKFIEIFSILKSSTVTDFQEERDFEKNIMTLLF